MFKHNLVVHESDLPLGKGWSPLTWQILEGKNRIPVTMIEAEKKVDSGVIYAQEWMEFQSHELVEELRAAQAEATIRLCKKFVREYPGIVDSAREQKGEESFYSKRKPEDSRLDPDKSIREQFNLLRVVDNEKYPAFFDMHGQRYLLKIKKKRV
jgi:methionyl-tRNA formyltransferase